MARRILSPKLRACRPAAWGACLTLVSAGVAAGQTPTPTPAAAVAAEVTPEVAKLVRALDDDRFATREAAQLKLVTLGPAALPAIGQAAANGSLESSTRAVSILLQWSQSEDTSLSLGALERLATLTNRPAEAAMAADKLADVREMAAMKTIVDLGGRVEFDRQVSSFAGTPSLQVVIGPKWTGGKEGLANIAAVRHATTVSMYSAAISGDDAVPELSSIKNLVRVEFYGTEVSDTALAELRAALPHALVDVRGGARLGIAAGQPVPNGALVGDVNAGTSAAKAGLVPGDVITDIDGVPVADFESLTRQIAKVKPGQTITLKVLRQGALGQPGPTPIDVTVEFSRWGDEQAVNPNAPSPLGGLPTTMPTGVFINQR